MKDLAQWLNLVSLRGKLGDLFHNQISKLLLAGSDNDPTCHLSSIQSTKIFLVLSVVETITSSVSKSAESKYQLGGYYLPPSPRLIYYSIASLAVKLEQDVIYSWFFRGSL